MKILVYPWDKNPYQKQLYSALKKARPGTRATYAFRFPFVWWLALPLWLVAARLTGHRIVHLHWPKLEFGHGPTALRHWLTERSYRCFLPLIKRLGYRLVWTVHNVLPHEPQTGDDASLMRYLSRMADGKIIHSPYTLSQMESHGLDTANTVVIPHGNYDGVYPAGITPTAAKAQLGLPADARIVLFLGKIRPYKGVDDLLAAFNAQDGSKAHLVIAGQCSSPELEATIQEACAQNGRIHYIPGHIPDSDIARYFTASDVVCLPFKAITTSGSVLLSLTFGKPLIAPLSGATHDLPPSCGYLYDPSKPHALETALAAALDSTPSELQTKAAAARAYADTLNWDTIAEKTAAFYEDILAAKR